MARRRWEELEEEERRRLRLFLDSIAEKKGERTVVLDLRELSTTVDYFVITEGSTDKQVEAIAANIMERLDGPAPITEGLDSKRWVVLDYGDVMIHIFQPEVRRFYDLEGLWGETELEVDGGTSS